MPAASCRRNRPGSSPSSPTAWSTTCWISGGRGTDHGGQTRKKTEGPKPSVLCRPSTVVCRPLLQPERHEPQLAIGAGHQEQRGTAAVPFELVDLGLEVV